MDPSQRKQQFVALVAETTERQLKAQTRRHTACVSPTLGPVLLAQRFRPDRLPDEPELSRLAEGLVAWALGIVPSTQRPYAESDLERSG
ncbi:MAG: hypothetical protein IPI67_09935 [Myxococcales bacterium]|nr:hypothetical protein [Myxococcales bacterium]